ncbi:MAG: hypothetical protein ABI446_11440 [Gemmatimonadaceae bacterium]
MKHLIRTALIVAGATALAAARPYAAPNPMTIVIGNGPFAGTYSSHAATTMCLHAKTEQFYSSSFKNLEAKGARALTEGMIKVDTPDKPGAKTGDLHVLFGSDKKSETRYDVYGVAITMTMKGGDKAELAGAGKTKDGIAIRISASCVDITSM